jgi:plasmid replication initiation protein
MRLYELLKEFEFRKNRSFELSHLRFLLNISETKYSKYTDFKKRVLLSSQKELEEKTDISFIFEEIRESRKVVKINFTIISKQKEILEDINSLNNSLQGILKTKLFLSNIQIKTVLKQFDNDYINRNITYTLNQKNIKNIS